jgi:hypothetical protein
MTQLWQQVRLTEPSLNQQHKIFGQSQLIALTEKILGINVIRLKKISAALFKA